MARSPRLLSSDFPYHVCVRCNNREWFDLPQDQTWTIFSDYLYFTRHAFDLKIHAFVMMSNHFHLLASTPNANLDKAMNYFLRETSRVLGFESRRINHKFGARYHSTLIKSYHYFMHSYKYVYRNPVDAGITNLAQDYPYSTLNGLLGNSPLFIPVEEDTMLSQYEVNRTLEWINTAYIEEDREVIKKALRKNEFILAKNKNRQSSPMENRLS